MPSDHLDIYLWFNLAFSRLWSFLSGKNENEGGKKCQNNKAYSRTQTLLKKKNSFIQYNFLLTRLFFCLRQRPNWGPRPSGLTAEVKPRPPGWATDITSWGQRSSRATCTCGDWPTTPSTGSGAGRQWRWDTFASSGTKIQLTHNLCR